MSNLAYASDKSQAPSLVPLQELYQDRMSLVNKKILSSLECSVPLIHEIAGYLIRQGGKRLRPLLTLASADLCGYQGQEHIGLAAAVEFIHTATLLHDDVVDESVLRRGVATANTVWDNTASVLVGDFLFSRAFQLMVEQGSLSILKVLSDASARIAEGEVMQLASSRNIHLLEDQYLEVIGAKTACLFEAATHVGGLVANASESQVKAIQKFGFYLGVAFQLTDDVLDYSSTKEAFGKSIGDDFSEGKVTLPIIFAYQKGSQNQKNFIKKCFADLIQEEGDLHRMVEILNETNSLRLTLEKAKACIDRAQSCLNMFSDSPTKSALVEALDFVLTRNS